MPECPFCHISAGAASAAVVYQDERLAAFLDHRPVFHGHVLVVPRAHIETLGDAPADLLAELMTLVQRVSDAVESALSADGSFVAINNRVSQSVPHLHVHVVPRRKGDGLRGFFWPRSRYADDHEMADTARRIRAAIATS